MPNQLERLSEHAEIFDNPDIILPSQFFGGLGGKSLSAEQRLMLAVLADAINLLQANRQTSTRNRRDFAEAGTWIATRGDKPFSFDNICDALSINSEMLRQRLTSIVKGIGPRGGLDHISVLRLSNVSRPQNMTLNRVKDRNRRARRLTP